MAPGACCSFYHGVDYFRSGFLIACKIYMYIFFLLLTPMSFYKFKARPYFDGNYGSEEWQA